MTSCLLVKQSQVNKPLQLTKHTGEGKRRGKPGTGRGTVSERLKGAEAEGSREDIVGFIVLLFFISTHSACLAKDVCEMD